MGVKKEVSKLAVKTFKEFAPNIKKYVTETFGEAKQNLFSSMAKNNHPKYLEITQDLDTLTKSTDESVRETLGYNVHQKLDGVFADGERLNTASKVTSIPQGTGGSLGRSKAHKAWKGTDKVGPLSLIAGTPASIIKKEPHNADKAMAWAREAYAYAQQGKSGNKRQPLRGMRRYVAEDGTLYKPKTLTGAGKGYQLKFPSMDLLKGYDDLRKLREAPWRKQEVIDQLQDILVQKGKEDKLDDLLKLMVKEYHKKLKGIKAAGQTKGHFISLEKGGFDIAENFGPQRGKSIKNKYGEWEAGNYAEGAGSSIPEGVSVPTTWEDYVDLKLPLLK